MELSVPIKNLCLWKLRQTHNQLCVCLMPVKKNTNIYTQSCGVTSVCGLIYCYRHGICFLRFFQQRFKHSSRKNFNPANVWSVWRDYDFNCRYHTRFNFQLSLHRRRPTCSLSQFYNLSPKSRKHEGKLLQRSLAVHVCTKEPLQS